MTPPDQRVRGIGMTSARTRERLVRRLSERGVTDKLVLERIRQVPRHLFVDEALSSRAYEDTALPIGHGQTISQPLIVALMTQALLAGGRPKKVLEIGTGCGYQTAVLAPLVGTVFTIERLGPLFHRARRLLWELGIDNVRLRHGDGLEGWVAQAPFDGIIVTAAPEHLPEKLLGQLAEGGRLVAPIGRRGRQELVLLERHGNTLESSSLGAVSFVPLVSGTR